MKVKLESFLQEISEKTTENNQYPVLTSSKAGLFLQSDYFNKQVASKDNTGYKIIRRGQFTYRAMSDTGEFFPNMLECTDIGIVSPAYPVFEITKPEIIIPEFLKYFFKSDSFQYSIAAFAQGSTRTSVKFGKMKTVFIDLPSVFEQQHIIEVLDRAKSIISDREQVLTKLDDLIKARFVELFGDDSPTVKLGDICKMINGDRGKNYPSGNDFVSEGVPFVNAGHLQDRQVNFSDMNYITEEKFNLLSQGKMQPDDILYCLRGSLGKHGLVTFEHGAVASSLVILRCDKEKILPKFLLYAIETPDIERQLKAANNGSSQPNLSAASVKAYNIKLPSIAEQETFVKFVEQVDKSKFLRKYYETRTENSCSPLRQ